ncbi:MAG: hypothetical protein ABSE62_16060 [Chthoniobacteraceae bacterium]
MKKEVFVCDNCGRKQRLDITKRHWCDVCAGRKETEMRPVRVKAAANMN